MPDRPSEEHERRDGREEREVEQEGEDPWDARPDGGSSR